MQFYLKKILVVSLSFSSLCFAAVPLEPLTPGGPGGKDKLPQYLLNLGKYLGYDLKQYCQTGGACQNQLMGGETPEMGGEEQGGLGGGGGMGGAGNFSNLLLDENTTQLNQLSLFNSFLGALLGIPTKQSIVPKNANSPYSELNGLAMKTFIQPPFNSPSPGSVSVSPLMDQQTYQTDPVSQAILNIVSTPGSSYCKKDASTIVNAQCDYLNRDRVLSQVIGDLPTPTQFFSADYTQKFLGQLNIDSLLTPLMYSTETTEQNTFSSSPTSGSQENAGLQAKSEAERAANFIRYVSGSVAPTALPDRELYGKFYNQAKNIDQKTGSIAVQRSAASVLNNYLLRLRTFAAQNSVGISNLYFILSKRMPQTVEGEKPTSQALDEFKMATWRLFNPASKNTAGGNENENQWLAKLNKASGASVQKEIAILLAEINYQLYLTRQQQERQLLVDTILLMQNSRTSQIEPTLSSIQGGNF